VLALIFAFWKSGWVTKQDAGTDAMKTIALAIREGAMAFLKRRVQASLIFVVVVAGLLAWANAGLGDSHALIARRLRRGCRLLGPRRLLRHAGGHQRQRAHRRRRPTGLNPRPHRVQRRRRHGHERRGPRRARPRRPLHALQPSLACWRETPRPHGTDHMVVLNVLSGFSLGASSIALFARVGGGIFTKAADVGADLVGKVEAGIPEDDPRNPATIADNVGDNVGDVAGMGADLFESYVGAIIGSMVLGLAWMSAMAPAASSTRSCSRCSWPGAGIVVSILGTFFVRVKEGGNPQKALDAAPFAAGIIMLAVSYFLVKLFSSATSPPGRHDSRAARDLHPHRRLLRHRRWPRRRHPHRRRHRVLHQRPLQARSSIADESQTGPATNIISGLGVGMVSTAHPHHPHLRRDPRRLLPAGLYGIAIAALGMLATTGIQLAVDAYGPIADNAGGIAEMAHLPKEVRERTDRLDAVGNTTAAIGKGFAIGSAA
jgi:K(+)-stimulated pyrophosphate-energized sodium pump